jgi:hypothetical protein
VLGRAQSGLAKISADLKTSTFVLILENARNILAAADEECGTADERKADGSAVTRQTSDPE